MPYIIDARREGGDVIFLGKTVTLPSSNDPVDVAAPPLLGSLRFNAVTSVPEVYRKLTTNTYGWDALLFLSQATVSGATSLDVVGTNGISSTGGPITTAGTISLSLVPTGVVADTYTNASITVDLYGRITTASNGEIIQPGLTSVSLTADNNFTVTGSPITSSGTINVVLKTSGVTANTYTNATITVDAYGRITSASSGATTSISSFGITSTDLQITGSPLTSSGTIDLELKPTGIIEGVYANPTINIDSKGRIVGIASSNLTGIVTPEMYGAVGNGITDDHVAFASMGSDPTVTMIHLDRNYAVSQPISFPAGATVFGGGIGQITPISGNTVAMRLNLPQTIRTQTVFKNVIFDGSIYVNSTAMVSGSLSSSLGGVSLEECQVNGAAVLVGKNHVVKNNTITANSSRSITILNTDDGVGTIGGNSYIGGIIVSATSTTGLVSMIRILGNQIVGSLSTPTGSYLYGVYVDASLSVSNVGVHVDGNSIKGFVKPVFTNYCNTMVSNNSISGFTSNAIVIQSDSNRQIAGVQVNNNSLTTDSIFSPMPMILVGGAASNPNNAYALMQTIVTNNIVNNTGQTNTITMISHNGVKGLLSGFNRFTDPSSSANFGTYGSMATITPEVF